MTLNEFMKWLSTCRELPWEIVARPSSVVRRGLRCNNRCPLQVLTGTWDDYCNKARRKFALSRRAVSLIIQASDNHQEPSAQRLRARMLRILGLQE